MPFPTALLAGPLIDIVNKVLGRVLPAEKMSQADRLRLETELQLAIMAQDWKEVEAEFSDRASARSLAAADTAKGNAFTTMLAAIVRPMWGLGALALVAYSVLFDKEIGSAFYGIIQTLLMFYFGGRTIEKLAPSVLRGYEAKQDSKTDVETAKGKAEVAKIKELKEPAEELKEPSQANREPAS